MMPQRDTGLDVVNTLLYPEREAANVQFCGGCGYRIGECECCSDADPDYEDENGENPPEGHNGRFWPVGKGPFFMGLELEVEGDNTRWAEFIGPQWIHSIGADGSLHCGFEIRSQPHSIEEWRKVAPHVKETLKRLKDAGFQSWDTTTCGLHIHTSKNAWSSLQVWKLLTVVFKNRRWVESAGGRPTNSYCSLTNDKESISSRARRKFGFNKYEAVNLLNDNTVEFRFFRGTLRFERIARNLEWVHALWTWTKEVSIKSCTPATFELWAKKNHKRYPMLAGNQTPSLWDTLVE